VFTYTVAAGHTAADLDYVSTSSLALNGGTIKDAAGNDATLTLPAPGATGSLGVNKSLVIDTTAPTVSALSPLDEATDVGVNADLVITFSEDVVAGSGHILLRKSSDTSVIEQIAVADAKVTVSGSQVTVNPSVTLESQTEYYIQLDAGSFEDAAGNPYAGIADTTSWNFTIADIIAPTVSNVTSDKPDGAYKAAEVINVQVTFSEIVNVTGTPQITLETGASDAVVNYTSGSGSAILVFTYTVAAGHTAADLDYVAINSLALNGGAIKDAAGNDAILTLPAPAGAGSLGANKNIVLDTTAPAAPTAPDLLAASDTGTLNTDNVTDVTTPTFDITGVEPYSTVTLTSNGNVVLGTAIVPEGGNSCSITPATPMSQGAHVITATQADLAGNISAVSAAMAPNLFIAVSPTVTTQAVTGMTTTTATGHGDLTALGLPSPTAHGMVWNTAGSPTLSDYFTNEGGASSAGAFVSSLTGLSANTTYYVRAYATNTLLTVYGNEVTFASLQTYTLLVTSAHGTVTPVPAQALYDHGTSVVLTAAPATGYTFVNWTGDATGSVNPLTVTMDANKSITANYSLNTYTLLVTSAHGTVTPVPDQALYDHGTSVVLTAAPATGYTFVNWTGDATGSVNPLTVTMDANKSITANYSLNTYTLTYTAGAGGSITGTSPQTVNHGSSGAEVTAVPSTGYHFVSWSDDVMTAARTDTNVTTNISVTANFAINTQRWALITLYNATGGENWWNQSNWKAQPVEIDGFGPYGSEGTWLGVTMNAENTLVTVLNLGNNNLIGTLPTSLVDLTGLKTIYLNNNQLSGSIPATLGSLSNLQFLYLNNNQLSGSIPATLGSLSNLY
jgi:uncharacterized repeat protein (TIGR02543 family)